MLRVLIVEDEEIILKWLTYANDWLGMGCVVVDTATDGIEGLKKLETTGCDVVITDIKMPRMSGIEMLETAAALGITGFLSIVLTSYADFEYAQRAIKLHAFDYLLKPIDSEKLKDVMRRVALELGKAAPQPPTIEPIIHLELDNLALESNSYVSYAVDRIRENYRDKLSIDLIAEEQGISSSYLTRKFKSVTSMTFLDMLNQYRVQKSLEFLLQGRYRVYEVSDMTGFSDYKHFCHVFRKYVGKSPTEFLREVGSKNPELPSKTDPT